MKYAYPDVKLTQDQCTSDFSAQTYIGHLKEHADCLLGIDNMDKLHLYNYPMKYEYHTETDNTSLLSRDYTYKYRMRIGSVIWSVTLGRYGVMYAVVTL